MPIVNVLLWEGRTIEQKRNIAKKITETLVVEANVPKEAVIVTFEDFNKGDWAEAGQLAADKVRIENK